MHSEVQEGMHPVKDTVLLKTTLTLFCSLLTIMRVKPKRSQTFLVIQSLLRQRAHNFTEKVEPSTSVLILTRFGFQVRRVRFLAWLTLLPVTVCFPQISQTLDILSFLKNKPLGVKIQQFIIYTEFRKKCKAPLPSIKGSGRVTLKAQIPAAYPKTSCTGHYRYILLR